MSFEDSQLLARKAIKKTQLFLALFKYRETITFNVLAHQVCLILSNNIESKRCVLLYLEIGYIVRSILLSAEDHI